MSHLSHSMTCFPPRPSAGVALRERPAVRKQTQDKEQAQERERRIAECLQRVLLRATAGEALRGLSVEAFQEAALDEAAVGGDSGDAFALAGDRVALAVADASGKGLDAAERIAEIRFALRAFLREHDDPGRALSCLNDFVCDAQRLGQRNDDTFATLTLVVLDGASGEAICLCAGGEPPLLLRAGGSIEVVPICGPALGLFPNQGYSAAAVRLEADDTIILTTDGITEARGLALESPTRERVGPFLGLEGLARLVVQAQDISQAQELSPPFFEIAQSIFESARRYAGGSFHDDTCLLFGRRKDL